MADLAEELLGQGMAEPIIDALCDLGPECVCDLELWELQIAKRLGTGTNSVPVESLMHRVHRDDIRDYGVAVTALKTGAVRRFPTHAQAMKFFHSLGGRDVGREFPAHKAARAVRGKGVFVLD